MVSGVAVLVAVAAIGACGSTATKEATSSSAASSASSAQTSTSAQAPAHNKADMMFAQMMIPHHEQAVEMSDIILDQQGIDPRVVDLARQIKAAQDPEIEQMQGWLVAWGMADMPGHDGMHGSDMAGMEGMMSPAEMDALENAQGAEAGKLFLTGMIKHHQGALAMAQDEVANGQFPDAVALAKSILESQQKEIDTMNEILKSL